MKHGPIDWFTLTRLEAKALSEILVRSASVKRKASKGAVRLQKRLWATCAEIVGK